MKEKHNPFVKAVTDQAEELLKKFEGYRRLYEVDPLPAQSPQDLYLLNRYLLNLLCKQNDALKNYYQPQIDILQRELWEIKVTLNSIRDFSNKRRR
jgi:hypothetical protein